MIPTFRPNRLVKNRFYRICWARATEKVVGPFLLNAALIDRAVILFLAPWVEIGTV